MTLYDKAQIVSSNKIELKPIFVQKYQKLLGDKYEDFIKISFTYMRKCIRVNTLKISVKDLKSRLEKQGWVLTSVPWCKEGFFVEGHKTMHRFDIGNLIEHTLGYFYVQEASSMIPPVALFQNAEFGMRNSDSENQLQDSECSEQESNNFVVLDLCAAPGSKTTQLAQYMNNKGVLIANDVDAARLMPLSLNLQRMGVTNTIVTHNSLKRFFPNEKYKREGVLFDKILVDAPCSGTGTIRKSFKVLEMYSEGMIKRLVKIQRELICDAFDLLKVNGEMVYSTCTQEPEENEGVVSYLLDKYPNAKLEKIRLNIKKSEPILEWEGKKYNSQLKDAIRIYPMDNDSEGFFICKLKKV
ncbi:MAG: RsmB/NOP family class I SAM-dependent RNA methyltransferase [Candidatus Nanoarchaeia archaeon]|nr:RsmB/NOP family class I SAM-dependent RNA methyltransferase [Candidatus Nanoarchaeia archaeon]